MLDVEPLYLKIGASEVEEISVTATTMVQLVRQHMFAPGSLKHPPRLTVSDICSYAKKTRAQFYASVKKENKLPTGVKKNNRLDYTLDEARQWVKFLTPGRQKNPSVNCAVTISVANFKGGVTKTTTTATLAQGLSLRGYDVLVIDLDPQGSLSNLFGLLADIDVEENQTVMELYAGTQKTIDPAIQRTYWSGIDIVAASPVLHNAEFILPVRQQKEAGFNFGSILDLGLDSAREKYDVILIDTPPSLSYTTVNALMAADGIIMPLPPSPLDFASSAQFWNLCNDIMKGLTLGKNAPEKKYNFIDVVLCRVDKSVGVSSVVRDWIIRSYGAKVIPVEIPKTAIADTASAGFGTVYDVQSTPSLAKTLKRAKDAYEQFVDHIETQIQGVWVGVLNTENRKNNP